MAFLVSSVESQLLEKIITKLEWKSYFRLQQTCKQMEEMIRTNKNIKGIRADMTVHYYEDIRFYSIKDSDNDDDCDHVFGVCWKKFYIDMVEDENFNFLKFFENNRITCTYLEFYKRSDIEWELEKYSRMLKILKPRTLRRTDHEDDFYPTFDALFDVIGLEEIDINLQLGNTQEFYQIVTRLVSHFCNVKLLVFPTELTQEEVYHLLSKILQYIHSETLPQFKNLNIIMSSMTYTGLSSTDYLHALLRSHNPIADAVPNLNTIEYEITTGDYNYTEHSFIESSTAVLDLSGINMKCQIDCRRWHFHGTVMRGPTHKIGISRM